ncbi:MAG TPA: hypothetical protein VNW97_07830 [Candidatus Saccharimonadales bacterium]|jgi:hypothetical protein|nr:hypothetical protein [Candidatus Saccharimonadales bacterium]
MEAITPEDVRAEVQRFWTQFTGKYKSKFQEFYKPTAAVFSIDGRRSEPARLMWVRREREFFDPRAVAAAKLGAIKVQVLRPNLAVATYAFHFSVVRILPNGNRVQSEIPFSRATQVFQRDDNGTLQIIHEHLSSGEPVVSKELPEQ